jgi:tRNA A37 threonylcarbamoyladenosine dehydratase
MERFVDKEFIELLHSKTSDYKIDCYDSLIKI